MRCAGIDCGLSGGVSLIEDGNVLLSIKMPLEEIGEKKRPDVKQILTILDENCIKDVYIERQGIRENDSKGAGATTMVNYGLILGAFEGYNWFIFPDCRLQINTVMPNSWMTKVFKLFGIQKLDEKGEKREKKSRSFELANKLWPEFSFIPPRGRVNHDGMVESALIGYYGYLKEREK